MNKHIKPKVVGGIGEKKSNGGTQYYQQDRIYDGSTIAPALPASLSPGGSYYFLVYESEKKEDATEKTFLIGASRGRNPINPNDRSAGIPTEQRLEINKDGICNTLTTVLKDNYVIEIEEVSDE